MITEQGLSVMSKYSF